MRVENFSDIEEAFIGRVEDAVWCSFATVDRNGRPRSRVLHPIWEGKTGWVATGRQSHKAKHLAETPYVSLAYLKDPLNPVYVDCHASWIDDMEEKRRIWDLLQTTPTPVGYDPTPFFGSVESPAYGVLKLKPWRIELYSLGGEGQVWRES